MRRFNVKLFVSLLLAVAVVSGLVGAAHALQYHRIAAALMDQTRRAREATPPQYDRMQSYLTRYLGYEPQDFEAHALLGETLAGDAFAGQPRQRLRAVNELDKVLQHDPSRADLRRLLVKAALEIGRLKEARDALNQLLPEKEAVWPAGGPPAPDAARGELEAFWGQIYEAEVKPAKAVALYRQAVQDAPSNRDSYIRLAYLLRRQPESDPAARAALAQEADGLLDRMIAANADAYEAYLARWRYRRDFQNLKSDGVLDAQMLEKEVQKLKDWAEDVAQAYRRAPEREVVDASGRTTTHRPIDVLLAKADVERLRADLVEMRPEDPAQEDRGRAEKTRLMREHRAEARKFLNEALDSDAASEEARYAVLWYLANLTLDELDPFAAGRDLDPAEHRRSADDVVKVIAKVRQSRAGIPASADFLQGRLLMGARKWDEAVRVLEQARPALQKQVELADQIDQYLGQCYQQLEEPNQALAAFNRVVRRSPLSVPARLGLAETLYSLGRVDEALENYRQVMARDRVPVAGWIDVARLELERQLQRDPAERDWSRVAADLDRAEKLDDSATAIPILRAELMLAQSPDNLPEAQALLQKAVTLQPKKVELWVARAALYTHRKSASKPLDILDEAEAALGDVVDLRLARARHWAAQPASPDRQAAFDALATPTTKAGKEYSPEELDRLLSGLAAAHFQAEDVPGTRALLTRLTGLPTRKADLRVRLLAFDLAIKARDEDGMAKNLEEVRSADGDQGAYYKLGQALLALWQARQRQQTDQIAVARERLAEVEKVRPRWARLFLARAEAAELSDDAESAIADLRRANALGETSPDTLLRLVNLLRKQQRFEEAGAEVQKLRGWQMRNSPLGRVAAELALRSGDGARGLELALQSVPEDSKKIDELLLMANALEMNNQPEKAEEKLKKAVDMAGSDPEAWVALVQIYAAQRRTDEVVKVLLPKASARIAPDKAPLALAQCYEALGAAYVDETMKRYEDVLKKQPRDVAAVRNAARYFLQHGRLEESKVLLDRIIKRDVDRPSQRDVTWATHGLAVLLAAGTDYKDFGKALGLVELQLDDRGLLVHPVNPANLTPDQLLAQARVLATQPQRTFRDQAVELLEAADRSGRLEPGDQFILALLYDAGGNWLKSAEKFRALVESDRGRSPEYLTQYVLRLLRQNELDEAARQVKALERLEKARNVPAGALGTVELNARLLEKRGDGDKAMRLLADYIKRPEARPEEMLFLIASLGRQQKFREAFALCPDAWSKCPPEAAGGVTVALLRVMKPTDAQCEQAEGWLRTAIEKNPKNMALRMHLADLYDMRGAYDRSEQLYRDVLAVEKGNVIALNNLAWLLAQHANKGEEALPYIDAAVQGVGRRADLLDTHGLVQLSRGHTDEALADLREAAADAPSPTRLFHLARALDAANDREAAKKTLREARKLGLTPDGLHPHEQLVCRRLLEKLGMN